MDGGLRRDIEQCLTASFVPRSARCRVHCRYFAPFFFVPTANPPSLPALDALLLVAPVVDLLSETPVFCLTSFKMPSWLPRFLCTN